MLAELDDLDSNSGWVPFFQKLNWIAKENAASQKIAKLPDNRQYNRYRDVLPYDHSRIILDAKDGGPDYINASLVEVPSVGRRYILCQGPLKHTSAHFWQMVWEQKSKAIIMLNRVIEKNQIKCYQYWPCGEEVGHTSVLEFGNYRITLIDENMSEFFTVKTLELYDIERDEMRTIFHYHYLHWPDFGVPSSPASFLSFLFEARDAGVLSNDVGPAIVHCSAGIGRSGTFVMVDCILKEVQNTKDLNGVNVKERLLDIRKYRLGLIQTPDQLRFTYAAILEGTNMLLPDVYERALDTFMATRGEVEEEEDDEEPPPLPPPRKRPEEQTDNVNKKKKKSESPETTKKVTAPNLSSDESDGEDEIIDLSESSEEDETESKRKDKKVVKSDKADKKTDKESSRSKDKRKETKDKEVVKNGKADKKTDKERSSSKERKTELRKRDKQAKNEDTTSDESIQSKEKKEDTQQWVISIVKKSLIVIAICSVAYIAYRYFRFGRGRIPKPRRGRRF